MVSRNRYSIFRTRHEPEYIEKKQATGQRKLSAPEDSGLSSTMAASVFAPIAATGAIVQLLGGLLIGRVSIRLLLVVSLGMMSLVLVLAPSLSSLEMAYFFGFCMGVQGGLEMIVSSIVFANFFEPFTQEYCTIDSSTFSSI